MESPPSITTWSEAFMLSDDSGLLLTNGSISSGSMSGDSNKGGYKHMTLEDSDCEDKSISQDSLDEMSDIMCGGNFNTLKKGPNWTDFPMKQSSPIEPPLEFQDNPRYTFLEDFFDCLATKILNRAICEYREMEMRKFKVLNQLHYRSSHHLMLGRSYYNSDFIPFSPCHGRPGSRSSLGSSRLSSSHNSLSVPAAHKVDDSSFITQAVSHDTLSSNQISDLYNVPFDSDMYAVPVDVVKPPLKPKRNPQNKKRRRNTASECREFEMKPYRVISNKKNTLRSDRYQWCFHKESKRHSVAGTSAPLEGEPIHMTLQEVRHYLQTLYSSSSDSSDYRERCYKPKTSLIVNADNKYSSETKNYVHKEVNHVTNSNGKVKKNTFLINIKNKKVKDSCDNIGKQINISQTNKTDKQKKAPAKLFSFKQTLCNMFRFKRLLSTADQDKCDVSDVQRKSNNYISSTNLAEDTQNNISSRALPPLPLKEEEEPIEEQSLDFATSIQRVKDYGWYWGPLPSEVAEKILSNEPDGSFIVRDSSDDHYIFSLTFKLNNCVRHVRIDHDQGNFSFGSRTKFKSQTIVEFIENAVEHSRSGRYLFFLHRRPVIGPVRVQLLHPVSRFKQVQSLQHICRFIIHKVVRRDLIPSLPLPRRMIDYLNTPHYYSEHLIDVEDTSNEPVPSRNPTPAIRCDYQEEHAQAVPTAATPFNNYILLNNTNPRQS